MFTKWKKGLSFSRNAKQDLNHILFDEAKSGRYIYLGITLFESDLVV